MILFNNLVSRLRGNDITPLSLQLPHVHGVGLGHTGNVTVTFTLGATQAVNAAAFVVTFDTGWTVPASPAVTVSTSNGIGSTAVTNVTPTNAPTGVGQVVTIDSTGVGLIGAGAIVQLTFTNIVNPSTIGNFGCTVKSQAETTAIASSQITTKAPTIPVVPGIITVWNSAGIELTQTTDMNAAIAAVTAGGTIKVSAGTYNNNFTTGNAVQLGYSFTIQGTDASAANVILMSTAPWTLSGKTVVVDSVTIDGTNTGLLTINDTTAGGSATVSNSIIQKGYLTVANASTATTTCNKDTFPVKTGAVGLWIPGGNANTTTITACTFNVTGTGYGLEAQSKITVSGSTFTGAAVTDNSTNLTGLGIWLIADTGSNIGTSTFTGLAPAFVDNAGGANFNGNTVTACGVASAPSVSAFVVTGVPAGTGLYIMNNKITNSPEYIITVNGGAGSDAAVFVMDNTFSGNAKNANNVTSGVKLNVTHNYWGATAPSSTASPNWVDYSMPLGSAPTSANFAAGSPTSFDATATAGVNVTAIAGASIVGAAALTGNPVTPTIASTNTVVKYFDVFGIGTTTATIDFFGATANSITANSQIFVYNTTYGTWQACTNQTVNVFGNYVEVKILGNSTEVPSATQFTGLPFALVTVPTVLGGVTPGTTALYPAVGQVNVPITNMTFTWPAVSGSGVTYQFALAQASANTSANEFAILDYSDNTLTNAEPSQETLQYNTVYWWEVRAVTLNSSGAVSATGPWSIQMFTTMPQPVTTTGTSGTTTTVVSSIIITNPVTTVVQTNTQLVITTTSGTSTPAIPSYLLWAVIAVGAVLIIAVIVLIVRTRRIP